MKYTILIFAITLALSCKQSNNKQALTEDRILAEEISPNWLIGSWERLGEKEGKKTYEYWK